MFRPHSRFVRAILLHLWSQTKLALEELDAAILMPQITKEMLLYCYLMKAEVLLKEVDEVKELEKEKEKEVMDVINLALTVDQNNPDIFLFRAKVNLIISIFDFICMPYL